MENEWTKRIMELAAENKRLAALNDMFPQEIARLEDRVSAEYEAERADDRARIQELEAEVGRLMLMNPCNHTGFESAPCDICGYPDPRKLIARLKDERADDRAKIEELKKENKRLRELVDGATVAVELFKDTAPAQKKWREEWLNKAREALKEASHE